MQLSRQEHLVWEKLEQNQLSIFTAKDLRRLLGMTAMKAYNIIKALKKKKVIVSAGKRYFRLQEVDDLVVGQTIHHPSYLSFWSALAYYGLSDQVPRTIFYATTKYTPKISPFMYVTLSGKRFFGYKSVGTLTIAEPEKALIDSLLMPRYAGGMKEVQKALQAASGRVDVAKIKQYALRMGSNVLVRRLGFLLEGLEYTKEAHFLQQKIGKKGYELLDPTMKRKNNFNKRWLLDINW